jgi:hypothetical protein
MNEQVDEKNNNDDIIERSIEDNSAFSSMPLRKGRTVSSKDSVAESVVFAGMNSMERQVPPALPVVRRRLPTRIKLRPKPSKNTGTLSSLSSSSASQRYYLTPHPSDILVPSLDDEFVDEEETRRQGHHRKASSREVEDACEESSNLESLPTLKKRIRSTTNELTLSPLILSKKRSSSFMEDGQEEGKPSSTPYDVAAGGSKKVRRDDGSSPFIAIQVSPSPRKAGGQQEHRSSTLQSFHSSPWKGDHIDSPDKASSSAATPLGIGITKPLPTRASKVLFANKGTSSRAGCKIKRHDHHHHHQQQQQQQKRSSFSFSSFSAFSSPRTG